MKIISFTSAEPVDAPKPRRSRKKGDTATATATTKSTLEKTPASDEFTSSKKRNPVVYVAPLAATGGLIAGLIGGHFATKSGISNNKPEPYDYTQTRIESTKKDDPDYMEALNKKREAQGKVAEVYKDGDDLYIVIDPDLDKEITAEAIEKLFDIEDGALDKHNYLDMKYTETEPDDNGIKAAYSTSEHVFEAGDLIKVPESKISDTIDLEDYGYSPSETSEDDTEETEEED